MNKRLKLLVIIPLTLSLIAPSLARSKAVPPKALRDVPANHWAADEVRELYESGVMVGDPNGAFRGNTPITRYEMAIALSNLISNNNRELLEDREDLASLVNIMEQFQNELSAIDAKLSKISSELGIVYGTVGAVQEQSEEVSTKIDATGAEIAVIKGDVEKLKNRGLIYGTLIKGVANDANTAAKGIVYAAKKITNNDDKGKKDFNRTKEVDAEVIEQVVVPLPAKAAVETVTKTVKTVTEVEEPQEEAPVIEAEPEAEPAPVTPPVVETKKTVKKTTVETKVETKKVEEPKQVTPIQDTGTHSYVPRMQTPPLQRSAAPSYETAKAQAPSPKATKVEDSHEYHSSQELDGELIQEIHQTLQEMH